MERYRRHKRPKNDGVRIIDDEVIATVPHSDAIAQVVRGEPYKLAPGANLRKVEVGGEIGRTPDGVRIHVLFENHGDKPVEPGLKVQNYRYVGYAANPEHFEQDRTKLLTIAEENARRLNR